MPDVPQYEKDVDWILTTQGGILNKSQSARIARNICAALLDSKTFLIATTETLTDKGFETLQEHARKFHASVKAGA